MDFDQATRAGILASGLRLFNKLSISEVMVDDIVREAGVTKKVFYRFFRRKDDFIVECYLVHAGDMLALYRRILGQPGDAQARILAVFSVLERVAASAEFTGCGLMRVGAGLGNRRDHPLRLVVSGFKHAVEGLFETILAEEGHRDARPYARELAVILDGSLAQVLFHDEPDYARDGARLAIRVIEAARSTRLSAGE
ncbi:MAG: TetR/AcrR family transcriptional regulator [Rhabdaerophilum sp.]